MKDLKNKCRCALCGEIVTCPIFFEGKIYGYTCIKKVNPTYKRKKTHYVVAESFDTIQYDNGNIGIEAFYQGTNHRRLTFIDCHIIRTSVDGRQRISTNGIELVDGVAYIDLLKYGKTIF